MDEHTVAMAIDSLQEIIDDHGTVASVEADREILVKMRKRLQHLVGQLDLLLDVTE